MRVKHLELINPELCTQGRGGALPAQLVAPVAAAIGHGYPCLSRRSRARV
jgi:hypothetical protein